LVTARIGKAAYRGLLDDSTSPPKERYAVSNDNVFKLIQPGTFDDQLTEILRQGARTLLAQAVEVEVADFVAKHALATIYHRPPPQIH
jgi:putative transposase